ncbi:MAG: ribonuclease D [Halioglobus sp.]
MNWELIVSDDALAQKLDSVAGCETVMVDTEFMRRDTFYPQIALLQLCFVGSGENEKTAWLIDPLAISDLSPLIDLLTDPAVLKVLHSASEDLEVFMQWLGVVPTPMFDTQRAAAVLDRGFGLGYRALVQSICDVDLPKGETRSNWLKRPLTEAQCEYAGLDVTWLLPVWRELHAASVDAGKLAWVLADGEDAASAMGSVQVDYYKRVKTAWKLNPEALGRLQAVCQWREVEARERDRPRSWIIDDKACLQLAIEAPEDESALRAIELPPSVHRRYAQRLLELIEQQGWVPESELPARLPGPLEAAQRDRLKRLKAQARQIAQGLDVAPEYLLAAKDYELLIRQAEGATIVPPKPWAGWREAAVVEPLQAFLRGEK